MDYHIEPSVTVTVIEPLACSITVGSGDVVVEESAGNFTILDYHHAPSARVYCTATRTQRLALREIFSALSEDTALSSSHHDHVRGARDYLNRYHD